MIRFVFLTIFPEIFDVYTELSIWKKAKEKAIIDTDIINIRDFSVDKHKTVDDRPFGGGPGMVMMVEPVVRALEHVKDKYKQSVLFSFLMDPKGKVITQEFVQAFAKKFFDNKQKDHSNTVFKDVVLVFISPRYEGIDARIRDVVDYVVSIGPYVLSGGELPALVVADAFVRLVPSVLGNELSAMKDSEFIVKDKEVFLRQDYPDYTRPREIMIQNKRYSVPSVLLEGNHSLIAEWRSKFSVKKPLEFLGAKDI